MATREQAWHRNAKGELAFGYSQCIRADGVLYVSGIIAMDARGQVNGNIRQQMAAVYEALHVILAAQGLSLKDVVKETVFITDMDAALEANDIRIEAYRGTEAYPPACSMVGVVRLARPEALVELESIAHFSAPGH